MNKTVRILLCIIITFALVLSVSMALSQQRTLQRQIVPQQLPKAIYSKTPQPFALKRDSELGKIITPRPVSSPDRLNLIKQISSSAGLTATLAPPPVQVTLTPYAPRMRQNWYEIINGYNYPKGGIRWGSTQSPFSTIRGMPSMQSSPISAIDFLFYETIPGKTYFLDISVGDSGVFWKIEGAANIPSIPSQNGHIFAGFTAASSKSIIRLMKHGYNLGGFFKCELTRIN